MAQFSRVTYVGTGAVFNASFSFPYLSQSDIFVFVDGVSVPFTFLNTSTVTPVAVPPAGVTIQVRRATQKDTSPVNFTDGSVLLERDLDLLATYSLYMAQEADDAVTSSMTMNTSNLFDAQGVRIINVAQPVSPGDAATKGWVESLTAAQRDAINAAVGASASNAETAALSVASTQAVLEQAEEQAALAGSRAGESATSAAAADLSRSQTQTAIAAAGLPADLGGQANKFLKVLPAENGYQLVDSAAAPRFYGLRLVNSATEIEVVWGNDEDYDASTFAAWMIEENVTLAVQNNNLVILI